MMKCIGALCIAAAFLMTIEYVVLSVWGNRPDLYAFLKWACSLLAVVGLCFIVAGSVADRRKYRRRTLGSLMWCRGCGRLGAGPCCVDCRH